MKLSTSEPSVAVCIKGMHYFTLTKILVRDLLEGEDRSRVQINQGNTVFEKGKQPIFAYSQITDNWHYIFKQIH